MCTQYLLKYFQKSQYSVLTQVLFLSTRFIPGCHKEVIVIQIHLYSIINNKVKIDIKDKFWTYIMCVSKCKIGLQYFLTFGKDI